MWSLSSGVCAQLASGSEEQGTHPVLQVLEIALQVGRDGAKRFRLLLSDGVGVIYALCTDGIADEIHCNSIEKGCVLHITDYIVTKAVNGKNVLIVVAVIVKSQQLSIIGNPVNAYVDPTSAAAHPAGLQYQGGGKGGRFGAASTPVLIKDMEPEGKYTLRGKVVSRTDLRSWTNAKGEGVYMSFDVADATGVVKCTAFRDAASKLDPLLRIGGCYVLTAFQARAADKNYNTTSVDIELVASNGSTAKEVPADGVPAAAAPETTVALGMLHLQTKGNVVDVIGVLAKVGPLAEVRSDLIKRALELADTSGRVELSTWGRTAEEFALSANTVVVVRGAKVGWFNNQATLSLTRGSTIEVAGGEAAAALHEWWAAPGQQQQQQQPDTTSPIPLASVESAGGTGVVRGRITAVNPCAVAYPACPRCRKGVRPAPPPPPNMPQLYRCDPCEGDVHPTFQYVVAVVVADASAAAEVVCFGDTAQRLLGGMDAGDFVRQGGAPGDLLAHVRRLLVDLEVTMEVRAKAAGGNGNGNGNVQQNQGPSYTCIRVC